MKLNFHVLNTPAHLILCQTSVFITSTHLNWKPTKFLTLLSSEKGICISGIHTYVIYKTFQSIQVDSLQYTARLTYHNFQIHYNVRYICYSWYHSIQVDTLECMIILGKHLFTDSLKLYLFKFFFLLQILFSNSLQKYLSEWILSTRHLQM